MTAIKYNARDVNFEVEDPDAPGTWLQILGIETFSKGHDEETVETTDFQSQGEAESEKMQIGKTMQIEGKRFRDDVTGVGDPGQAAVEKLSERLGHASNGGFRFAHKADTTWEVWSAHVNLGDQGGGNNDKTSWSATFTRSGSATTAAKA